MIFSKKTWKKSLRMPESTDESDVDTDDGEMEIVSSANTLTNDEVAIEVAVGEYVAAVYDKMPYIGKVIDLDEDSVHVDFMEPCVKENSLSQTFQWPSRTDDVWVERSGILGVISAPEDTKRGFKLAAEIVSNILELRSVWLITHKNC